MKSRLLHQDGETRTYLLVMDAGDEACAEITAFARDRGIRGATVTAIGAVDEATLGVFAAELGGFWLKHFDEQLEIASFIGDIATGSEGPTLHAHAVLGGRDCVAYAGHAEALHVNPTMEVVLTESPAHLVKRLDPSSGLAVIAIDETRADDVPSESRTTPPVPRGINHIASRCPISRRRPASSSTRSGRRSRTTGSCDRIRRAAVPRSRRSSGCRRAHGSSCSA